jgi:hypothetical protein
MNISNKFDVSQLKGRLYIIGKWMKEHHVPPKTLFFLMGIISLVWFFIRVLPKPSRAAYPCMKVAAPMISSFVIYLLSVGGLGLAIKKARLFLARNRYLASGVFLIIAAFAFFVLTTYNPIPGISRSMQETQAKLGPDDQPNQPFGTPAGIYPGRVVWAWNQDATNENCISTLVEKDWYWKPENINEEVVAAMLRESLMKLTGENDIAGSWSALFKFHNKRKYNTEKGYAKGEKIYIKTNQGTSRGLLTQEEKDQGYYYPANLEPDNSRRSTSFGTTETHPYVVLELLRQLVNEFGIDQTDIAV